MKYRGGHTGRNQPEEKVSRPDLMEEEYREGLTLLRRACRLWDGDKATQNEKNEYAQDAEITWGEREYAQEVARGMAREFFKHHRKAGEIATNMLGGWRDAALDLEIAREGRPPAYPVDADTRKEREE